MSITLWILLLSMLGWPFTIGLVAMELNFFYSIIVAFGGLFAVIFFSRHLVAREFDNPDPHMCVFALMGYYSFLGFGIVLDMDGFISMFSNYFEVAINKDEPFLKSAYAATGFYWDGLVNFPVLLLAITLYTHSRSYREAAIFYCGSMLSFSAVFLPGQMSGPYDWSPATPKNFALASVPIIVLIRLINQRPCQTGTTQKHLSIWTRPADVLFIVYFLCAGALAIFRGMVVQGGNADVLKNYTKTYEPFIADPTGFPRYQMLNYQYFFFVYYLFVLYGLIYPGQHWMSDWSIFHAGAAAQTQGSYILASLHPRTSKALRPPMVGNAALVYWSINLALLILPQLFAWYCHRNPDNFGHTYTVEKAHPKACKTATQYSERLQKKSE